MKQYTISQRITAGFVTLLAISAGLGVFSYLRVTHLDKLSATVTQQVVPKAILLNEIRADVKENQLNVYRHAAAGKDDLKRRAELEEALKKTSENTSGLYKKLEGYITTADDRALLDRISEARSTFGKARAAVLEKNRALGAEEAAKNVTTLRAPYDSYMAALETLAQTAVRKNDEAAVQLAADASNARVWIASGVISALIFGAAAAYFINRQISRALNVLATQLGDGSAQVASAATQVSSSSQTLASGASEQAASLEETSASLEEISSMTKRNAESASQAKSLANQTRSAAETGSGDMHAMSTAMDAIKSSSDNIAKIIKTIDEIAFQTNILALNAAVEAARAGEAGAGFAVVAEEVRALAQRSAQAAKETAEKIEDSIQKSEHGVQISGKVAASLTEIVEKARKVDSLIAEIAQASQEQSQGIGQVLTAVGDMDKVTQGNAASAEEGAAAAEELSAQAQMMDQAVTDLQQLIGSHRGGKPATSQPAASTPPPPAKRTLAPAATKASHSPRQAMAVAASADQDAFFH